MTPQRRLRLAVLGTILFVGATVLGLVLPSRHHEAKRRTLGTTTNKVVRAGSPAEAVRQVAELANDRDVLRVICTKGKPTALCAADFAGGSCQTWTVDRNTSRVFSSSPLIRRAKATRKRDAVGCIRSR